MTYTQQEVEEQMYQGGILRTEKRMQTAEETGNAHRNPYAATLLRDFVLPFAERIQSDLEVRKVGPAAAHIALLRPLDPEAVALLTVRQVLSYLLAGEDPKVRRVGYAVGTIIHSELVLAELEHLSPDLYHTLAQDFGRRKSKSTRHRMTVFKMQAAKAGITVSEWATGAREQVGLYLLDTLARMGMIDIDAPPTVKGKRATVGTQNMLVRLSPEVQAVVQEIKELVAVTMPMYGPCVEPPKDWAHVWDGGFHTEQMRRQHRCLIKAPSAARELFSSAVMPTVLSAVNALQRTAWRVNGRILDVVQEVSQTADIGEIVLLRDSTRPPPPAWLKDTSSGGNMSPEEAAEFQVWKRAMAEWYTQRKLAGVKYGRYHSATRSAEFFREQEALYFVYFADSRGRLYPLTYGVNPQGSDLQKALLEFSEGKPLHTEDAVRWFLIHGANKWGFDKATLAERAAWYKDKHKLLMAIASDPTGNLMWRDADCPLQFLAWCLEYADWQIDPQGFESRIAVSMDGSCNG